MADTTTQVYESKQPDWMEALHQGLIADVQTATSTANPIAAYNVAGLAPEQQNAVMMAAQGIGSYQPYLQNAGNLYGQAQQQFGQTANYGANALSSAQAGQNAAQGLINTAGQDYSQMGQLGTQGIQSVQQGMGAAQGYLGAAGQGYSQAGQYGSNAAALGMAGTQNYDPNSVSQYMNPYTNEVTQQTLQEMNRQAAIQNQGVAAQAVEAGAFGGSRFGVQEAEQAKNLATAQGQVISQANQANYSQAQQAAMSAFQNQQARVQNAGQMSLGAGSLAAQQGAGLGQLGQQQFAMGQGLANQQTNAANLYGQQATGLASLGNQQYNMGLGVGQMGISAGQLNNQVASGLQGLGASQAALGQTTQALGQGDTSFQYNIGADLQAQNQKLLDAQRLNQQLQNQEPYQRLSYYSDILNNTPSGQQSMTSTTAPTPSPFSQIAGLGIAGLGAYNAATKAGVS